MPTMSDRGIANRNGDNITAAHTTLLSVIPGYLYRSLTISRAGDGLGKLLYNRKQMLNT